MVLPARIKPSCEFRGSIVVHHIHIQLALVRKPRKRQIAAAHVAHHRINWVCTKAKVQLGVQRVLQKQLHNNLLLFQLPRKPPQSCFVGVRRRPEH